MQNRLLRKIAILSVSAVVTSWGALNVVIAPMASAYPDVPLELVENFVTVSSLFMMFAVLLSHVIAHRVGYKRSILLGLGLVAVSGMIPLFLQNFYLMFLCRVFLGFGIGMFHALLVSVNKYNYDGEERTHMFGFQSAFEGVGGISVTYAVGQLVKQDWHQAFIVYAIAIPAFLLFALFVPAMDRHRMIEMEQEEARRTAATTVSSRGGSLRVAGYVALVFVLSTLYIGMGIKVSTLIKTTGIGTATDGATVLLLVGVGAMLSGLVFGRMVKWLGRWTLPLFAALLACSLFLIGASRVVWLSSVGGFLSGMSFRTIMPYLLNHLNNGTVKNSRLVTSLVLVALNFGAFASPFSTWAIQRATGVESISGLLYVMSLFPAALAVGTFGYELTKRRRVLG